MQIDAHDALALLDRKRRAFGIYQAVRESDPRWVCPLPDPDSRLDLPVEAGERTAAPSA